MSARRLAAGALLAASACAHARAARLSEADELYRLAIFSLSGGDRSFYAAERPVCLAVAGGDPSPALLAAVRTRLPRAVPKSRCPITSSTNADARGGYQWLAVGAISYHPSGTASVGWDQGLGLGGTCTFQSPGAEHRVVCIGI